MSRRLDAARRLIRLAATVALSTLAAAPGCGHSSSPDARYPARAMGCAVKKVGGEPSAPVDDLGPVAIDCVPGARSCERQLLDAVCAVGGDVAWGLDVNALTASRLQARAAHTRRAVTGPREPGCAVAAFVDAPSMHVENIGPVRASCSAGDTRDVCTRELEDQVCLLGGDVLWEIEGPSPDGDHQIMRGRAAHTR
jgi:hypothetical protein